jgi:predicted permease
VRTPLQRLYVLMMRITPAAFRKRWGRDMEEAFADRLERAGSSFVRRGGVVCAAAFDLIVFAIRERTPRGRPTPFPNTRQTIMFGILQDLRYAARTLAHAPGFSLVAITTLAVGIGASTATYSVVYPVLIEAPPYADADRLVVVWPEANVNRSLVAIADEQMASLEKVSGISDWTLTLTGTGEPREVTGTLVSPHHFDLLGARPLLGRDFAADEYIPAQADVVILSYNFWVTDFGADPEIVGRVIDLAGAGHERRQVIGVMPREFRPLGAKTAVWVPLEGDPALGLEEDPTWYVNTRIGRLAPGATLVQANAEVRAHAMDVQARIPTIITDEVVATASVARLSTYRAGNVGQALWVALGAVAFVLLIACANLANLLLSRGDARAGELAVRAALGAGRRRIGRLVLLETVILGSIGGALGVGLAFGLVRLLVQQAPADFPAIASVDVSAPVLMVAVASTVLATMLAGLLPVYRASRADSSAALAGATRGRAGVDRVRLGAALVGVQIALALMVAVGSGLMLRSLGALLAVETGLDPARVVVFRPNPPAGRYPDGAAYRDYYRRVSERVAAVPGVESIGAIHILPGTSSNWSFPTYPEGFEIPEGAPVPSANFRAVRTGYFETVRIPLLAGRLLSDRDDAGAQRAVVVNRAFADLYWPGEDPLGKQLSMFSRTADPAFVVGVVGDVRQHSRAMEPLPEMYFPHAQVAWNELTMWIVARLDSDEPLRHAAALREAVWSIDADVPISGMEELAGTLARSTESTRFLTLLLSGFAGLALMLGAVGVFGVTTYTVGRRIPEFGVRVALGASRGAVLTAAMRRSLTPVVFGVMAGVAGSLGASRLLRQVLYGVEANDPLTLVVVPLVLGAVAALATLAPAWRASGVDPVTVLNSE